MLSALLPAQNLDGPVKLAAIQVEGTRLPKDSVLRILSLHVGDTVDNKSLLAACDRLTKTGLIADIDYSFLPHPSASGATLVVKIWDEKHLLPASVFPEQNESAVWSCLQSSDPIFTRNLPNTRDALRFYVANIDTCIKQTSDQPLHAEAKVLCDAASKPAQIQFRIEPGAAPNPPL